MMKYLSNLNWWKQLSLNALTLLTALLAALTTAHIHVNWFTSDTVNVIAQFIIAFGIFFVGSCAGLINTYLTIKSKEKAAKVAEQHQKEQEAAAVAKVEAAKQIVASAGNTQPSTEGPVTVIPVHSN
ncbi:hypothetical protein [Heyndrickxia acidicola]|uniref:Holin n=1 Tax=Heyndrickxia acidicola TaxID=209389 RepID=A0ABU6MBB7_9BACI|nr:hypothetical protein [Heyndrickxia acidicola]MED1201931.1 hypothetical protein [Heyndrickxia acidicola]